MTTENPTAQVPAETAPAAPAPAAAQEDSKMEDPKPETNTDRKFTKGIKFDPTLLPESNDPAEIRKQVCPPTPLHIPLRCATVMLTFLSAGRVLLLRLQPPLR